MSAQKQLLTTYQNEIYVPHIPPQTLEGRRELSDTWRLALDEAIIGQYNAESIIEDLMSSPQETRNIHRCHYCQFGNTSETLVQQHIEIQHGLERPFPCSYCSKRFTSNSILKMHLRVHTGEKPFVCSICQRSFSQNSTLTRHMKLVH